MMTHRYEVVSGIKQAIVNLPRGARFNIVRTLDPEKQGGADALAVRLLEDDITSWVG
jgi:hypothetical protein